MSVATTLSFDPTSIALAADQHLGSRSESTGAANAITQKAPAGRRRSQRVHLEIPVLVYGHRADGEPFFAETKTLSVNAHGALITLDMDVDRDQRLILTNPKSGEDVECRVVYLERNDSGGTDVGVEFLGPSRRFWGIAFPPEDWNPAERKRPQPRHP